MIWREEYKIGVELVDEQHQELFKRLGDFIQTVRSDQENSEKKKEVERTLNFMGEYVVTHFDAEEALQKRFNYPDFEEHHQIHEDFKAEVAEFQEKYSADEYDDDFLLEFSGRLLTWLINHVASTDQDIGEHINSVKEKEEELK
ncbi:bacteriohemerythrin [Halanaerobium saccharolyticum]|jgi:hemerythrin|uniref:Hemerythrin n=1 Tax=Halanaerobium saccharolyticum TaxID=43595 RepID=A0A2T5RRA8_9FIRM|nr:MULTISPECIES: bacteriohemerythrin [Halanaerobium]OEG61823.1 MAG: hemerythrin [Halanaerobium sp. MDAL1]PTW02686.1 hemerythrin [Halanaerobium saccharolyticum]PUU89614.1 MAG: hemerythrin-like metal-binding protein [Halanaerobium sp.]PUU95175.1 MAG: hemerythrin-like metal-binding protein [Halanaerobium sp.]TDP91240.1 hemerythrin [Halanaerobium saccharolyticum]